MNEELVRASGNGDRIRYAVRRIDPFELDFEAVIDGAILGRAVGDDENLGTALLENQLGRPGASVLEGRGVFLVEHVTEAAEPFEGRRRRDAVCVGPQLSHNCTVTPSSRGGKPSCDLTPPV